MKVEWLSKKILYLEVENLELGNGDINFEVIVEKWMEGLWANNRGVEGWRWCLVSNAKEKLEMKTEFIYTTIGSVEEETVEIVI